MEASAAVLMQQSTTAPLAELTGSAIVLIHIPETVTKLECGPMPNVMAAMPNIGCALCSTPQSLADAHY